MTPHFQSSGVGVLQLERSFDSGDAHRLAESCACPRDRAIAGQPPLPFLGLSGGFRSFGEDLGMSLPVSISQPWRLFSLAGRRPCRSRAYRPDVRISTHRPQGLRRLRRRRFVHRNSEELREPCLLLRCEHAPGHPPHRSLEAGRARPNAPRSILSLATIKLLIGRGFPPRATRVGSRDRPRFPFCFQTPGMRADRRSDCACAEACGSRR